MDALRINEPFGNNFRSRTASFKAKPHQPVIHSHCFELSIARATAFCHRVTAFDRRNEHFYFTPRE